MPRGVPGPEAAAKKAAAQEAAKAAVAAQAAPPAPAAPAVADVAEAPPAEPAPEAVADLAAEAAAEPVTDSPAEKPGEAPAPEDRLKALDISPVPAEPAVAQTPIQPISGTNGFYSPEQVAEEDEKTVTMVFPRPVLLQLSGHRKVQFLAGVQEVPKSLSEHPYLADNGVVPYKK